MLEQNFEEMLNESFKEIYVGEVVKGTVISVSENQIALNIGYKADGLVKKSDFTDDLELDLRTVVNIGDEMEVKVKKLNDGEGLVVLSRKELIQEELDKKLKSLYDSKQKMHGKVIKSNDGGLIIEVEPFVNVFMPKSLISNHIENDISKYLGQDLEFYITEYNPIKHRCIANRKTIVVEEEKKKREEAFSKIHQGDIIDGKIKSIYDYGVFVDLGGVDGLLHVTEMGWGKIKNPKKIYNVGDEIKVLVREIVDKKISLTAKFPEDNPWLNVRTKYGIGTNVKGVISRITDFGAFVTLEENIDGLLHISQISNNRVKRVRDVLSEGQEVEAQVIDLNEKEHRISLSMKVLEEIPEEVKDEDDRDVVDVDIEKYKLEHMNDYEEEQTKNNKQNKDENNVNIDNNINDNDNNQIDSNHDNVQTNNDVEHLDSSNDTNQTIDANNSEQITNENNSN